MSCFPCFKRNEDDNTTDNNAQAPIAQPKDFTPPPAKDASQVNNNNNNHNVTNPSFDTNINAPKNDNQSVKAYSFRELATATKNFRQECLLGEGGFGKVFKGSVSTTGQIVAVRQLDRNGVQASNEFVNEVLSLSFLKHPNLVKIIGYCADGEQRILVYEYMPSGSLRNHLFELPAGKKPLDWTARMKIALGIAEGLEFLHEKAKTPIIYRDLKSSNILLDEVNDPKLSEYGLAKLVQASSNKTHVAPSLMAGYGYGAPEYERQGEISLKSDVYSFGVVLLELITGRQALDTSLPTEEQKLVSWAQTFFRDPSRFPDMADPLLRNQFPVTSLNQAIGVAAMCLQEESIARPLISDISAALSFLAMAPPEAPIPARLVPILSSRVETCKFSSFTEANNFSDLTQGNSTTTNNNSDSESTDEDQECRLRPRNHKRGEHKHDVKSDSESEDEEQDYQMHHIRDKHKAKSEREAHYKHRKTHHIEAKHDEKSSSDYEYGNSNSESSNDELVTESKRLGLSSKCKRKKNSLPKKCRRLRSKSSSLSSSSRDYSISFNLRCNSASMDKNDSSTSRHDVVEHIDSYGHYNNGSSGEESYAGSRNSDRDGHKVKSESEENY